MRDIWLATLAVRQTCPAALQKSTSGAHQTSPSTPPPHKVPRVQRHVVRPAFGCQQLIEPRIVGEAARNSRSLHGLHHPEERLGEGGMPERINEACRNQMLENMGNSRILGGKWMDFVYFG